VASGEPPEAKSPVAIPFRILSSNPTLRPRLACEITPEGVIAARQQRDEEAAMSFAPLPVGIVKPGLGDPNFTEPALVVAALSKALEEIGSREKQLTLVVPDAAVRVLTLDFDSLPAKAPEALPIVRFRLRKLMPFEVDDAAVSYQIMRQKQEQMHVLVTVMPALVRMEYESAVRAAGYEPGVVLPSTLAALAALTTNDAALVIRRNGLSLTTAITSGDELLLHRTLELPVNEGLRYEELAQSVSVARAYFEDTLKTSPDVLYYVGPGGAQEFMRALVDAGEEDGLRVRDLVTGPAMGAGGTLPRGLAAGVVGALAS
jgi:type IV pilus assembly protein PilM